MARSVKRPRAEPQAFHQLGKQGRKTGIVLHDRGERDEHGMQPLDSIFSPHEPRPPSSHDEESDDSGSVEMSIASSAGPGPQTLLKNRHSVTYPIPKSKSPIKTNLKSPAKRNPHLEHLSSPSRSTLTDDRDVTVTRKIDFSAHSKPRRSSGKGTTSISRPSVRHAHTDETDLPSDSVPGNQNDPTMSDMVEQSMQLVNAMHSDNFTAGGFDTGMDDVPAAEETVEIPEEPRLPSAKPSPTQKPPPPLPSIFGTRKRSSVEMASEEGQSENDEAADKEMEQQKRQRTSMPPPPRPAPPRPAPPRPRVATAPPVAKPKPPLPKTETRPVKRGRGRPRKTERRPRPAEEDDQGDDTIMEIHRGPPLPRARGLVSVRNESGADAQTRSGRQSARPVDYWRAGAVDGWSGDEADADEALARRTGRASPLPPGREIIRLPVDAPPSRRAPRSKTRTKAGATAGIREAVHEDEELEEWEMDEGQVSGDIVVWEAEHELNPPNDDDEVQITQDRLAIAADAIQMQDTAEATFRFAKTLTLPFIGAGVVDLPPGAEKRPKNSRKMHMVFFVHYGKVLVTVNEAQFRISAGGTWFVPRGNYYSITNDYPVPARIFFAQACEVATGSGA